MFSRYSRAFASAGLAVALVLGSAVAASAAPTPDRGPETGGTAVSVDEPRVSFTQISTGRDHTVAIGSDGNAYAWGQNSEGQLGNGTARAQSYLPALVKTPAGVTFTQVSAGYRSTLAIGSDGKIYAWGMNSWGQLGVGTTTDRYAPVQVNTPPGVTFTQVSMRAATALAVGSDGNTYAWGRGANGQLGNGTAEHRSTPGLVQAPAGITFTQVSTGGNHSLALGSDKRIYAWGDNEDGALGDGTTTRRTTPVAVHTPAGVAFSQVSSAYAQSHAIGTDGKTYAWGSNRYGQLGDGTTTDRFAPVTVQLPAGVTFTSVTSGLYGGAAIGSDGHAYTWGRNLYGQLGDGTNTPRSTPGQVQTPSGVTLTQIDGNESQYLGLDSDGNGYGWGANAGVLGNGAFASSPVPVKVLMDIQITEVAFGGSIGTGLTDKGDGTWSVTTPPHATGPVDVVVSWTLNGAAQTPITYTDGFTYEPLAAAPTVTDPQDVTVDESDDASFSVLVNGAPGVKVSWEISEDGGHAWTPISAGPPSKTSKGGLSITVTGTKRDYSGYKYRAVASNSVGAVTSKAATLSVHTKSENANAAADGNSASGAVDGKNPVTPAVKAGLAQTGSNSQAPLILGGSLLLVAGAAIWLRLLARRRRACAGIAT